QLFAVPRRYPLFILASFSGIVIVRVRVGAVVRLVDRRLFDLYPLVGLLLAICHRLRYSCVLLCNKDVSYCVGIMSSRSHADCEHIFDIVKRCFQMNCTNELTIGDIIDKVKDNVSQREAEARWLTAKSLYNFFDHLPQNYQLTGETEDIYNVVVHFQTLLNCPACTKSKRVFSADTLAPANSLIKEAPKMGGKRNFTGTPFQKLLNEACAVIMNAFAALGRNSVPLLQLRKFLDNYELPSDVKDYIFRDRLSFGQFLLDRPYLFVQTGSFSYSMFDEQTASLLVCLNNAVWRGGNSVPIASLVSVAAEKDPSLNDVARLESFLARHGRMFKIEDGRVKVGCRIDGFERACELMERLG
ncbi:hypothetical protein M513_08769, partial [Trichuris suis]